MELSDKERYNAEILWGIVTKDRLAEFLKDNPHITCKTDENYAYFRNEKLPWYIKNEGNSTRITWDVMGWLTEDGLMYEINRGLRVVGITRITGYFTRVSGWNAGKRAELKDRMRHDI